MNKLRKGDHVVVLSGRDKGRRGTISKMILPDFAIVDGINVVKRHTKPNPMANVVGGIVDKTMPIRLSKLMVINPSSNKAERVRIRVKEGADKAKSNERYFKSSNDVVA